MGRKHAPLTSFKDRARSGLVRARQHARGWYAGHHRAHVPKWRSRRCGEASPSVTLIAEEFGTQLLVGPFEGIGHAVHCARRGGDQTVRVAVGSASMSSAVEGRLPSRISRDAGRCPSRATTRRARRQTVGAQQVRFESGTANPAAFGAGSSGLAV
jgi:hypothetical protein